MGIALPQFLLNIDGSSGGLLLFGIVGICILLPLVIAAIYLARSSNYTGNYVKNDTLGAYFHLMKPSLAPRYISYLSLSLFIWCKLYINPLNHGKTHSDNLEIYKLELNET